VMRRRERGDRLLRAQELGGIDGIDLHIGERARKLVGSRDAGAAQRRVGRLRGAFAVPHDDDGRRRPRFRTRAGGKQKKNEGNLTVHRANRICRRASMSGPDATPPPSASSVRP
jgi:hypothetical protein